MTRRAVAPEPWMGWHVVARAVCPGHVPDHAGDQGEILRSAQNDGERFGSGERSEAADPPGNEFPGGHNEVPPGLDTENPDTGIVRSLREAFSGRSPDPIKGKVSLVLPSSPLGRSLDRAPGQTDRDRSAVVGGCVNV